MAIRRIQGTQNWLSEHNKALKNGYPNKIRHSKMAIRTYQGTQKWLSEHIRASKTGYPRKCDTATSRNQGIHFWLSTRNQGTQIWLSTAILGIQIWLSIQKTMASSFGYPPKNIGTQNWLSRKNSGNEQNPWLSSLVITNECICFNFQSFLYQRKHLVCIHIGFLESPLIPPRSSKSNKTLLHSIHNV